MPLEVLAAALLAALALWVTVLWRIRLVDRRVESLQRIVKDVTERLGKLEGILGRALEAIGDIDEARRLREKRRRRYIAALIVSSSRLPRDPRVVQACIEDAVRRIGGEVLLADARPHLVYYDPVRGALIVRTNHLALDAVIAALVTVKSIGGVKAHIIPLRTAGTLSSARRALGILEKLPSRAG